MPLTAAEHHQSQQRQPLPESVGVIAQRLREAGGLAAIRPRGPTTTPTTTTPKEAKE